MSFPRHHPAKTENSHPERKLALVLSGGGPRGAMQLGALRVLMEEGVIPDMIVGTSIGAINGAFLARYGYNLETLERMITVWDHSARGDFAPDTFIRATLRNLLPAVNSKSYFEQVRTFYARHGIAPDLRFGDLSGPEFYIVTSDIRHYKAVIFGQRPDELVLDSMLASAAIPPWMPPIKIGDGMLLDGGVVSDVPIEPAITLGATEIIVLDLFDPAPPTDDTYGVASLVERVFTTMEVRHLELELALAEARNIPIQRWQLRYGIHIPLWDMSHTHNLIHKGYEIAQERFAEMKRLQEASEIAAEAPATTSELLARLRGRVSNLLRK